MPYGSYDASSNPYGYTSGYIPEKPGPQMPQKYPQVGPAYRQWGEIDGWLYDPWSDRYRPNPNAQKEVLEAQGIKEPEPPGLMETLGPVATVSGVTAAVPEIVKGVAGSWGAAPAAGATPAAAVGSGALTGNTLAAPSVISAKAVPAGTTATAPASGGLLAAAPYAGAAGAGLGAYGVYNATQMNDRKKAAISGGLSGAGMGAGLAMAAPLIGLGPLGWGALGLMALGGGALGGGLGAGLAHKSTKERERERWAKATKGNASAQAFYDQLKQNEKSQANYNGKVNQSYAPDAVGVQDDGNWVNNKFAGSRNESDLRPEDIWGSQDFFMNVPDWLTGYSEDQRRRGAQALLDQGLIREKKGGIYFTDDKKATEVLKNTMSGSSIPKAPNTNLVNYQGRMVDPGTAKRWREAAAQQQQQQKQKVGKYQNPGQGSGLLLK